MSRILTAEEFVMLVLAKIKLKANRDNFVLDSGVIDQQFEAAYNWLSSRVDKLDVAPNFTFGRDPLYGVTSTFRDALLSLRERRMIQPVPTSRAYRISLSKELADDLMKDGVLASADLDDLVSEVFPQAAAGSAS
ncbi:MAG: hypothetical protein U1D36_07835 [Hydrogenophaga sp.]|uniref:hypothetical protein n=1 Tax=Comamonadaceae TaxID=80864 RepID=UPI00273023A5|nr:MULTISPECIES: hypothetical protein [Comamonadaceae]MDP2440214.1 hypothetical protein [Rhodoferax sp.]MDZ4174368.1 hypothetical protein [Hydrogenophaga sp.]